VVWTEKKKESARLHSVQSRMVIVGFGESTLGLIFDGEAKSMSTFSATSAWVTFCPSSTIVSISGTTNLFSRAELMALAMRMDF